MKFVKKHRRLLIVTVISIITIFAMVNVIFAKVLVAVYCVIAISLAVYFIATHTWEVTYVKGRKPPIEVIGTRRK